MSKREDLDAPLVENEQLSAATGKKERSFSINDQPSPDKHNEDTVSPLPQPSSTRSALIKTAIGLTLAFLFIRASQTAGLYLASNAIVRDPKNLTGWNYGFSALCGLGITPASFILFTSLLVLPRCIIDHRCHKPILFQKAQVNPLPSYFRKMLLCETFVGLQGLTLPPLLKAFNEDQHRLAMLLTVTGLINLGVGLIIWGVAAGHYYYKANLAAEQASFSQGHEEGGYSPPAALIHSSSASD